MSSHQFEWCSSYFGISDISIGTYSSASIAENPHGVLRLVLIVLTCYFKEEMFIIQLKLARSQLSIGFLVSQNMASSYWRLALCQKNNATGVILAFLPKTIESANYYLACMLTIL